MTTQKRYVEQIVEEQVRKWQMIRPKTAPTPTPGRVVSVSREPGSGGRIVAAEVAERMGFDLFHQEVLHEMARSARVSARLMETVDERGLSVLEDWISSLVHDRHLWPDEYLQHLLKVIATLGRHGGVVLVGRGANFILPPEHRLRVRIIAPLDLRVKRVAENFSVPAEEARRRVIRTESDRRAFVRKYFHAEIADPAHYDIVLNTGFLELSDCARAVCGALQPAEGREDRKERRTSNAQRR